MATFNISSQEEEYFNLGTYHRLISSTSKDAQLWFDKGLIWTYGFNHEEAVACFEKAVSFDPHSAIAHWGIAYALGPNYNKPWEAFDKDELATNVTRTHAATAQAKRYSESASPVETALVLAIQSRYQHETPTANLSIWNAQYAEAMEIVYNKFPNDLDVAALYADSLMNLTPWRLWDLSSGKPATGARTLEAKAVLDRALSSDGGMQHPGLLHLYIHLMEMSSTPDAALIKADELRGLVPDAGHLNHMPSHIDILCGDYEKAIISNSDAVRADERCVVRMGELNFYTLYRCHNYHFLIYAAMFSGQSQVALDAVSGLENIISEDMLRVKSPPMADWLEGFLATRVHVLIRFGRWEDLLDLELPEDSELYCNTTAMIFYGRGVALAATGRIGEGQIQHKRFLEASKLVLPSRTIFNNTCIDLLAIASEMLDGELAYRQTEYDLAFKHLLKSIELDDGLPYDEPWGWMQPTRHAYGALLLEQGRVSEATKVYSADLGLDDTLPRARRHPNNVWALHGYHECLMRLERLEEAKAVELQLKTAVAATDVGVKSSCFCRIHVT